MSEALQRAILQAAAEREDGMVVISRVFDPDAAQIAVNDLLAAGWLGAIVALEGVPASTTDQRVPVSYEITDAGRAEAARLSQGRQLSEIRARMSVAKKLRVVK